MNKVGCFDSQNPGGYKRIPLESYVNGYNKLKFVYFPDVPTEKRLKLIDLASKRIMKIKKKKWWNPFGRYDYLGLIGQRLGIRWLQNPFKDFCSEREIKDINKAFKWGIKERLNPGELNDILKTLAKSKTYGYYVPED